MDRSAGDAPRFGDVADALGLGMAFQILAPADGQGRTFTYVGARCREMTGVDPAAALADARLLYQQIHPDDREAFLAAEEAAAQALQRFDVEVRMARPDGGQRWVRIASTPRQLPDGATLWDGLLSDVTQAKRWAAELAEQRRRLEAAVEATGLGLWEWDVRSGALTWTDRNREIFGLPAGEPVTITRYIELVHPDDREMIDQVYREASGKPEGGDFVLEHRTAEEFDGKPRWIQSRGRVVKDADGVKLVVGANLDITERKVAEERRTLLVGELAHRAKNGIQVMMAIVSQTARGVTSVREFEDVLIARLRAMAASQDLVTAAGGRAVQLSDVVAASLTPFDTRRFELDDGLASITIAGEVAVALALLLHEFSTNAVKYGALSAPSGRVIIGRSDGRGGQAVLKWVEDGGPEVKPAQRKGFGSRLIEVSLRNQGGKVDAEFDPSGFRASIEFPVAAERRPN